MLTDCLQSLTVQVLAKPNKHCFKKIWDLFIKKHVFPFSTQPPSAFRTILFATSIKCSWFLKILPKKYFSWNTVWLCGLKDNYFLKSNSQTLGKPCLFVQQSLTKLLDTSNVHVFLKYARILSKLFGLVILHKKIFLRLLQSLIWVTREERRVKQFFANKFVKNWRALKMAFIGQSVTNTQYTDIKMIS